MNKTTVLKWFSGLILAPLSLIAASSSLPSYAVPLRVGCIYQEAGRAKVAGYCTLKWHSSSKAELRWPDGINTQLSFDFSRRSLDDRVYIDYKNLGRVNHGSDFFSIGYQTTDGEYRNILIAGSCLRCDY